MEIDRVYVISLRRALFVGRDICLLRKHKVFTAVDDSAHACIGVWLVQPRCITLPLKKVVLNAVNI